MDRSFSIFSFYLEKRKSLKVVLLLSTKYYQRKGFNYYDKIHLCYRWRGFFYRKGIVAASLGRLLKIVD